MIHARPPGRARRLPRVAPFTAFRDVVDGAFIAEMRPVNMSEREAHPALERLFEKHRFDWRKPFCLTCYQRVARVALTEARYGDDHRRHAPSAHHDLRRRPARSDALLPIATPVASSVRLSCSRGSAASPSRNWSVKPRHHRASQSARVRGRRAPRWTAAQARSRRPSPAVRRPPATSHAARRAAPLSRWLDRNFAPSTAAARTTFLPDVERRSSSVRQHLVVLQRLANVSASEKWKNGTDADRAKLRQQVELEYQAVITHLQRARRTPQRAARHGHALVRVARTPLALRLAAPRLDGHAARHAPAVSPAAALRARRSPTRGNAALTSALRPRGFESLWESIHGNQRDGGA